MSCALRVPNQVSAGASRQTSDYSWHLGFLGSLVNSIVLAPKGEGASS